MKTRLTIALITVVFVLPTWAQMAVVRGKAVDTAGKPIAGAMVELNATDAHRRYDFKTDNKGQYFSIGVLTGTYDATLSKDGQVLDSVKGFSVSQSREENVLDFDLARAAAAEAKLSAEEKSKREADAKENQKIAGLNNMLAAARAASQAGNFDQAVTIMTQATQTDPTRDLLWAQLADAHLNAGRRAADKSDKAAAAGHYQEAIAALKKALELKPGEGRYYNNLATAYARLGQTQDAVQQYQLAAQHDRPNAARYYFNEGAVLTNAGKLEDANAAFTQAIAADPNYADAYYQRAINLLSKAQVDEKTGTMTAPPEVAAGLNKYLELAPNGPNAEGAKALLASLGGKVETSYGKTNKRK
jgi:tetratricopeptide (TPR) repeat protein